MPGLKSILSSRTTYSVTETNLEQGVIYAFSPGTYSHNSAMDSVGSHQLLAVPLWKYGELADLVLVCVAAVQDCQAMQVDILENLLK